MTGDAEVKAALVGLAEMYGEPLSASRLRLYSDVLSELEPHAVKAAIREIVRDPSVTRFPLPAAIAARVRPPDNANSAANEAANRIVGAMDKFGWNNPKEAREYIGELGWAVVERQGSWASLCENTRASDIPILKAQWREAAKAVFERAKAGAHESPPAIPAARNVQSLVGRVLEKLSLKPPASGGA